MFTAKPDIDSMPVIQLIRKQPKSYLLDDPDKLRIKHELPDARPVSPRRGDCCGCSARPARKPCYPQFAYKAYAPELLSEFIVAAPLGRIPRRNRCFGAGICLDSSSAQPRHSLQRSG